MPRVKMTPVVKMALYGIRIYLIVLLTLIVVKFVRVIPMAARPHASAPRRDVIHRGGAK